MRTQAYKLFWCVSGALCLMVGIGVRFGPGAFCLASFACLCAFTAGVVAGQEAQR